MRVEYKRSIIEKIEDAKRNAEIIKQPIEKIWLNETEWKEFCTWVIRNLSPYKNALDGRWLDETVKNMPQEISYDTFIVGVEK
jgi:hypothetical protein